QPAPRLPAFQLVVAEAVDGMIVYHAHRLHEGVADRRSDESKAALREVLAQCVRLRRARGNLGVHAPTIHPWRAADKGPEVLVEGAGLSLHAKKRLRIADRAFHLQAVAHDVRILQQAPHPRRPESRDPLGIEVRKSSTVSLSLPEDRRPAQARLRTLESEELKKHEFIMHGH